MHHDNPAGPRRNGLLQCMKIDLPSVVVEQRIPHQVDILNVRQKIEQRITGRGINNSSPGSQSVRNTYEYASLVLVVRKYLRLKRFPLDRHNRQRPRAERFQPLGLGS